MSYAQWASRSAATAMPPPAPPEFWKPPFQGPPPMPSNFGVSAAQWSAGFWAYNPAYASRPPPAASSSSQHPQPQQGYWAPSQHWHGVGGAASAQSQPPAAQQQAQAQQQQANYNPYKRQPRAPSAEYMASKLSDNPLGLTNMVPRDEIYHQPTEGAQHTPWVWNPRALKDEDDPEGGIITAEFKDSTGRRLASDFRMEVRNPSRQSSVEPPRRSSAENRRSSLDQSSSPYGGSSSASAAASRETLPHRHSSETIPQRFNREQTPARHHSAPATHPYQQHPSADPRNPVSSTTAASPTTNSSLDRSSSLNRHRSEPPPPQQHQLQQQSQVPPPSESFTSRVELQPTFSPKIVRTPNHYRQLEPSSTRTSTPISSPPAASFVSAPYGDSAVSKMEHLSLGGSNATAAKISRHQSLPAGAFLSASYDAPAAKPSTASHATASHESISDVTNFTDEPYSSVNSLSPMWPVADQITPPMGSRRPVARGGSVPVIPNSSSSLTSIPETQPIASSQTDGFLNAPRTSPHYPPHSPNHRSSSSSRRQSTDGHTVTPPSRSGPGGSPHNPLPMPPQEIRPAFSPPQRQPTPPEGAYARRFRKGFWNRRGDHLTIQGYVVYPPPHLRYPEELQDYPNVEEGFMDDRGAFVDYRKDRPELPESLPRHGRSPKVPYNDFVVYCYEYNR